MIVNDPPPALTILSACDEDCGFDVSETNESSGEPRLNCGGGADTVSVTAIVCVLPKRRCGSAGHRDRSRIGRIARELSARAALFGPTVMLPGVVVDPPTVSHGTEDVAVNASICVTMLEVTAIVAGDGADVVTDSQRNDAVAADRTRLGAFGATSGPPP